MDSLEFIACVFYAVSGAAGLLFSFDPTLTSGEVKALLIEGARAGGRYVSNKGVAGTIPMLNIYESLKLAAQRTGAPLCGNRVWSEGGAVFAQRGAAFDAPTERLFTTSASSSFLQVLHGGRRIWMWDGPDEMWRYDAGGWEKQTVGPEDHDAVFSEFGPSYRSYMGMSHGGDSILYVSQNGNALDVKVIYDTITWQETTLASIPLSIGGTQTEECINRAVYELGDPRVQACYATTSVGTVTSVARVSAAYPPYGDSALVAISTVYTHGQLDGDWYRCPQENTDTIFFYECHNASGGTSAEAYSVYRVSLTNGGYRLVESGVGAGIDEIVISEDGRDVLTRRLTSVASFGTMYWEGYRPSDLKYTVSGGGARTCILRFERRGVFGEREVETCTPNVGTFAPNRLRTPGQRLQVAPWQSQARSITIPSGRWLPALAAKRPPAGSPTRRRPGIAAR